MSSKKFTDQYVDLTSNGRVFPAWVLHNFKKYKLPEIITKEGEDPCNVKTKLELRKYQEFLGKYIGPGSPYAEILIYHGLGSGKTATAINLLNIFYNYDPSHNFIILIKASLRDDPWMMDMEKWLSKSIQNNKNAYENIHFVHYDAPNAGESFMKIVKKLDVTKPVLFMIDEVHLFISNVYSNITGGAGTRAQTIYDYIIRTKIDSPSTRIVVMSATPAIDKPFQIALLFNLLRPGIFPSSESEFNRIFVAESNYPILNPKTKNLFQRRILGLVSYYIGATPDRYAELRQFRIDLPMSNYQYNVYKPLEKMEREAEYRARAKGSSSKIFKGYTRQACNFVYPQISSVLNGRSRPKPREFGINNNIANSIHAGKDVDGIQSKKTEAKRKYVAALENFNRQAELYFQGVHKKDREIGYTIFDDLNDFKNNFDEKYESSISKYMKTETKRSTLYEKLYLSSPKALAIVFMTFICPGKVMVYSNYVNAEGMPVLKMYYRLIGFDDYKTASEFKGYCEYHGGVSKEQRKKIKREYNDSDNVFGEKCKVIMLSQSGTEGIQLLAVRQEHILEPHWNEIRIKQVIGRGYRQCSHKMLPVRDRVLDVYKYLVTKPPDIDIGDDEIPQSTDEYIDESAKSKDNLIESFMIAMKEAAVDCGLFSAHNKMTHDYPCFAFSNRSLLAKHIGPAYKKDIKDDMNENAGSNAVGTRTIKLKVAKVRAVVQESDGNFSEPRNYWFDKKSGTVYDETTHYPAGIVTITQDGIPNKLDKDTFIISDTINIPTIQSISA